MTTTQADPATMKARELRLLANRMRRANEPDLARQLDKRAAEVLLDIGGTGQDRKSSQAEAAQAWLALYVEALEAGDLLWRPGAKVSPDGWIGVHIEGQGIGLLRAWVTARLKAKRIAESVVLDWRFNGWIQPDAAGKTAMLTRGPEGQQRMIRMKSKALAEVRVILNAEPDR